MNYDPASYWPDRFARQGPDYVAKGGRRTSYLQEQAQINRVLHRVMPTVGTILDFGCGPGRFAEVLAEYGEYTGYDLVPEAAAMNPLRTVRQLTDVYDLGVAIQVLQHIPNKQVIRHAGSHARSWLIIDHEPLAKPDAHMHPRGPERIGELLGMTPQLHGYVLGHWVAVYQ